MLWNGSECNHVQEFKTTIIRDWNVQSNEKSNKTITNLV